MKLAMRNGWSLQSIYWPPIQNLIKGIGLVIWNYSAFCEHWTTMIRHFIGSLTEIALASTVKNTLVSFIALWFAFQGYNGDVSSLATNEHNKKCNQPWIFTGLMQFCGRKVTIRANTAVRKIASTGYYGVRNFMLSTVATMQVNIWCIDLQIYRTGASDVKRHVWLPLVLKCWSI